MAVKGLKNSISQRDIGTLEINSRILDLDTKVIQEVD
jgi:hypothetical protein